jgi:single-stranded DNA-specific DHH superfamily exonuclease
VFKGVSIVQIENKELIEQFKNYISSINKDNKIAILHDTDPDGLSASALVQISFKRLNKNIDLLISKHKYGRFITKEFIDELIQNKITHIISVDLPFESYVDIEKLSNFKIMVMDHHPVTNQNVPKNVLVIKPQFFQSKIEPSRVCASNVVYTFFSKIIDLSKEDWIATIGMIADITYEAEKEFIDKVFQKYNISIKSNPFDTDFGRLVNYVAYADCSDNKDDLIYAQKVLLDTIDYKEAKVKLEKFKIVEDEINYYIDNFPKNAQLINNIYFYEIKPKYFVGSIISTLTSLRKAQNYVLLVIEDKDNDELFNISARCQNKKFNMGKMMHEIASKLSGASGGGHIPAAGGKIRKEDKEKFKSLVIEWINNN